MRTKLSKIKYYYHRLDDSIATSTHFISNPMYTLYTMYTLLAPLRSEGAKTFSGVDGIGL